MNSIFAPKSSVSSVVAPKVGDLLCGSWGYDACLHTVVKVLKVTGASIVVQELDLKRNGGGMNWTSTVTNTPHGPVKTKRVNLRESGYSVKWTNYMNLYGPWTPCVLEEYNHH